ARAYHVLDQLRDQVKFESPDRAPDTLIITNYESLFPEAVKADDGRITDELVRAIQPLNLGRNLFAEAFPCPVLLCLPPAAIGVFLRSAPDLASWKSGFFKFESDLPAVRAELEQETKAKINWWTRRQRRRRTPEELFAETKRLEAIIADAEVMPSASLPEANRLIARLCHRLGWTAVALRDRAQARWAFAEMLRRAKEAGDQRLIGAAERGQRAAEAVIPVARLSPAQSTPVQQVFRGAAAMTEVEGLYGREDELQELIGRVTRAETRFLTVWGETGCGKTSLVLAGLVPELERQGHYLPVIVRQWDDPEADIIRALESAGQPGSLPLPAHTTGSEEQDNPPVRHVLPDLIQRFARETEKTVVIVCDQFEQFFTVHKQRRERASLLTAIGQSVNDLRVRCKFIFIVRQDHLGQMIEFELNKDAPVREPMEQRKRFHLPLFKAADAVRILRMQAGKAGLDWPENFVRGVVSDLTREERVRPIELQLVGAALAVSGISNQRAKLRLANQQNQPR
ncbi:MAG: AAA family ATPase, partial [Blastocatellia bacterium]